MKTIKLIRLLVVLLLWCGIAHAEPRLWGIANLGMSEYGGVAVQGHPKGFANVTFTNTFSKAYEEIDALLATGKVPLQEYNLAWRDNHKFHPSEFPSIAQEAKVYAGLAEKHPNVECVFSGATEHMLNKKDATKLAEMVLAVIPARCIYANNPWVGKGSFINPSPRIWNEVHNADAKPPNVGGKWIFNFDGSDCFDYDIEKIKKRLSAAEVFFFWTSQNNGRKNRNDKTPRPQRNAWPVPELLKAMAFLATKQGSVKMPGSNYTVKPKADQHNVPPEKRALKPVFIFPIKANRLELRDSSGKVIIQSSPPEPFADGRKRYYFNMYGYEIVAKAKQAVLNVFPVGGKKKIGTTNPGFRQ